MRRKIPMNFGDLDRYHSVFRRPHVAEIVGCGTWIGILTVPSSTLTICLISRMAPHLRLRVIGRIAANRAGFPLRQRRSSKGFLS